MKALLFVVSAALIDLACRLVHELKAGPRATSARPRSELVDALALALAEAENWIHDGLDGTSQLKGALRKLAPARRVLKKYRP